MSGLLDRGPVNIDGVVHRCALEETGTDYAIMGCRIYASYNPTLSDLARGYVRPGRHATSKVVTCLACVAGVRVYG